jgi:hypothetical protein
MYGPTYIFWANLTPFSRCSNEDFWADGRCLRNLRVEQAEQLAREKTEQDVSKLKLDDEMINFIVRTEPRVGQAYKELVQVTKQVTNQKFWNSYITFKHEHQEHPPPPPLLQLYTALREGVFNRDCDLDVADPRLPGDYGVAAEAAPAAFDAGRDQSRVRMLGQINMEAANVLDNKKELHGAERAARPDLPPHPVPQVLQAQGDHCLVRKISAAAAAATVGPDEALASWRAELAEVAAGGGRARCGAGLRQLVHLARIDGGHFEDGHVSHGP